MDKVLDDALVSSFPNLYKDRGGNKTNTLMCYGFPKKGWFLILWNLSEKLEKIILSLPEEERDKYSAFQVKEKFGTLRFYTGFSLPEMNKAIQEAELQSSLTCEDCGQPGQVKNIRGYMKCVCDFHSKEK